MFSLFVRVLIMCVFGMCLRIILYLFDVLFSLYVSLFVRFYICLKMCLCMLRFPMVLSVSLHPRFSVCLLILKLRVQLLCVRVSGL